MPYTVTLLPSEHSFKVEEGQRILAAGTRRGQFYAVLMPAGSVQHLQGSHRVGKR